MKARREMQKGNGNETDKSIYEAYSKKADCQTRRKERFNDGFVRFEG